LKIDAATNVAPPSLTRYVLRSIAVGLLCHLRHGVVPAAAAARFGLPAAAVHDPARAWPTVSWSACPGFLSLPNDFSFNQRTMFPGIRRGIVSESK
jgi:hypothetical protein